MALFILDSSNNVNIDPERPVLTNPHALNYLSQGIFALARSVCEKETAILSNNPPGTSLHLYSRDPMLMCEFHWFSVSIVNYMRVVGLIKVLNDDGKVEADIASIPDLKPRISAYVKQIIPEIKLWRDKVSGHFSATDPQRDNGATILYSIMNQISFLNDRFIVSAMALGHGPDISELRPWSITAEYERLISTHWQNAILTANNFVPPQYYFNGPPR